MNHQIRLIVLEASQKTSTSDKKYNLKMWAVPPYSTRGHHLEPGENLCTNAGAPENVFPRFSPIEMEHERFLMALGAVPRADFHPVVLTLRLSCVFCAAQESLSQSVDQTLRYLGLKLSSDQHQTLI